MQEVTWVAALDLICVTSNARIEREVGRAAGELMSCKHTTIKVSLTLSTQCTETSGKAK